jgi:hypothetical protein
MAAAGELECGHSKIYLGEDGLCDECCDESFDTIQSIIDEAGICTCNIICPEHKASAGDHRHDYTSGSYSASGIKLKCSCGFVKKLGFPTTPRVDSFI